MRRTSWTILACFCVATPALAIVPDNGLDSTFSFVGRNQFGSASLVAIAPRVVITAAHNNLNEFVTFSADASAPLFQLDLSSAFAIPGTDLKLYRALEDLPSWAAMDFAPVTSAFTHTVDAEGNVNSFTPTGSSADSLMGAGFGFTGGLNGTSSGYNVDLSSTQIRRAAPFRADSIGPIKVGDIGPFDSILSFLLANGDGAVAGGDSGGGAFKFVDGQWKLVGVISAQATDTSGYAFAEGSNLHSFSVFAAIAPHQEAIQNYIAVPEPAALAVLGIGFLALLRKKKH